MEKRVRECIVEATKLRKARKLTEARAAVHSRTRFSIARVASLSTGCKRCSCVAGAGAAGVVSWARAGASTNAAPRHKLRIRMAGNLYQRSATSGVTRVVGVRSQAPYSAADHEGLQQVDRDR